MAQNPARPSRKHFTDGGLTTRPKGTIIQLKDGRYQVRIRTVDGYRIRMREPLPQGTTEREARALAAKWQSIHGSKTKAEIQQGGSARVPRTRSPDMRGDWWERYFAYRESIEIESGRGIFKMHIEPIVGSKDMKFLTTEDVRKYRRYLDELAAEGKLSAKTVNNHWSLLTTACKAACGAWSKDKDGANLRVREDNPSDKVSPPDRHEPKQLQFLYPDEFLALVSCEQVPLDRRRNYALSIYLGTRASELQALDWSHIDLAHGVVTVRQAFDQETGKLKQTKTGNKGIRRFAIEPNLLPLLRAMHKESRGRGRLVILPARKHWARLLRVDLASAGVKRAELFSTDDTSKRLRFHDLRSTTLTYMALRSDNPLTIQNRAGHTTFEMTQRYIRTAENIKDSGEAIGQPFPPLPACLLAAPNAAAVTTSELPECLSVLPAENENGPNSDRSSQTIEIADENSGGAGNRTRVRKASS